MLKPTIVQQSHINMGIARILNSICLAGTLLNPEEPKFEAERLQQERGSWGGAAIPSSPATEFSGAL